ncbi:MAG: MBL fold metallo-hydrolase [Anaerolineae bacterium]|nr:MBL fold metallo-hydrolase [Anaerolineae bacterium]
MTTELILLGTGTPNLHPSRYQSSLVIIAEGQPYLVDCGGGTMQRVSRARDQFQLDALDMKRLTRLFLTHLHPDHTTGLPDFLIAPWVLERDAAVEVYGPRGTTHLVDGILSAYEIGIAEHRDGLAPINNPLSIQTGTISEGRIYQDAALTVDAFPASHGGLEAYSFKFATADKTIVVSGDTSPTEAMLGFAKGCDVLVHEVYSAERLKRRQPDWQRYHSQVHTSTEQLAEIANITRPDVLVMVHQLFWGASEAEILAEVTSRYDGEVICGHDLQRIL